MALLMPTIDGHPANDGHPAKITVKLSAIGPDGLIVRIQDGQEINSRDTAFLMLGADKEMPEWESDDAQPMGEELPADAEPEDEPKLRTGVTLPLHKATLEKYKDKETELRYFTRGESGMPYCSEPITLVIKP